MGGKRTKVIGKREEPGNDGVESIKDGWMKGRCGYDFGNAQGTRGHGKIRKKYRYQG